MLKGQTKGKSKEGDQVATFMQYRHARIKGGTYFFTARYVGWLEGAADKEVAGLR